MVFKYTFWNYPSLLIQLRVWISDLSKFILYVNVSAMFVYVLSLLCSSFSKIFQTNPKHTIKDMEPYDQNPVT